MTAMSNICNVAISYTTFWTLTCRPIRCWCIVFEAGATIWVDCRKISVDSTFTLTIRTFLKDPRVMSNMSDQQSAFLKLEYFAMVVQL